VDKTGQKLLRACPLSGKAVGRAIHCDLVRIGAATVNTAERDLEIERIRESYRPRAIRTLFVGESRPANGKFFYDSEPRPITRWFEKALELGGDNFLVRFRDSGLYLDDLVLTPVNLSTNADKAHLRREAVPGLRKRIARYAPNLVVAIMKGIGPFIREAAKDISPVEVVPFPGNSHQRKFLEEMRKLRSAILGSDSMPN
jgi:hypothetical protein